MSRYRLKKAPQGRATNSNQFTDLITRTEQTMSSQATVYTRNSLNMNHYTHNNKMGVDQSYEDNFDGQQINSVCITKEQEKVIQQILQIARKGVSIDQIQKINQNNAFVIPLKVVDAEKSDDQKQNNRFWKFASQLLGTSMNIYDKRVQNVYVNTHKISDKLSRISINIKEVGRDYKDDKEDKRKQYKMNKMQLIDTQIDNLEQSNLQKIKIGSSTLENKNKINVQRLQGQFISNPLMHKQLKLFDTYSISSLFLNAFQINNELQMKLFHLNAKQRTQLGTYQSQLPKELQQNINKIKFNCELFASINQFRRENFINQSKKDQPRNYDILANNESIIDLLEQMPLNKLGYEQYAQETIQPDLQIHSQPCFKLDYRSQDFGLSNQQTQNYNDFMVKSDYVDDSDLNLSVMTPWQLQFRNQKLFQKKIRSNKTLNKKKIAAIQKQMIDFNALQIQQKYLVLKLGKNKKWKKKYQEETYDQGQQKYNQNQLEEKTLKKIKYTSDKFVMPMHMNPYSIFHRRVHSMGGQKIKEPTSQLVQQQVQINDYNLETHQSLPQQQNKQFFVTNEFKQVPLQIENVGEYKKKMFRSIREIKQQIRCLLLRKSSISLSDSKLLDFGISSQSLFVTFLHIMNQNTYTIEMNQNQTNAVLRKK